MLSVRFYVKSHAYQLMNIKPKAYAILTISEIHKSEPFPKLISRENENVLVEQFSIFYTIFRIFAGDGLILFPAFPTLSLRRSINDVYSLHFFAIAVFSAPTGLKWPQPSCRFYIWYRVPNVNIPF